MRSQISEEQHQQYMHYLQAQIDKFSSFMITQKNLNDKHMHFQNILNYVHQKIEKNQQKMALIEIYQNDNLFQCKKMNKQRQKTKILEVRLDTIQSQLKKIYKKELTSQNKIYTLSQKQINKKQEHLSSKQAQKEQRPTLNSKKQKQKINTLQYQTYSQDQIIKTQSQKSIEMHSSTLYEMHKQDQEEIYRYVQQIRQNFQIQIKKNQIEIQKNKQSIIRLSNHLNNLSTSNNINLQKFKRESRAILPKLHSQSTKQMTSNQAINNSQKVTKKQFKKMERRLHSLFSEKLQEATNKFRKNSVKNQNFERAKKQQPLSLKKYKFKTLQDQFQKGVGIKTPRNKEQPCQYWSNQKQLNSNRKKSLFKNDLLKDKNLQNHEKQSKNNSKKKRNYKIEEQLRDKDENRPKNKQKRQNSKQKGKNSKQKRKTSKQKKVKKTSSTNDKQINDYMIY